MSNICTKDQFVFRVHLLRHNHSAAAMAKEERQLVDHIHLIYEVIRKQKELKITSYVYRKRMYSSEQRRGDNSVPIPGHIRIAED